MGTQLNARLLFGIVVRRTSPPASAGLLDDCAISMQKLLFGRIDSCIFVTCIRIDGRDRCSSQSGEQLSGGCGAEHQAIGAISGKARCLARPSNCPLAGLPTSHAGCRGNTKGRGCNKYFFDSDRRHHNQSHRTQRTKKTACPLPDKEHRIRTPRLFQTGLVLPLSAMFAGV
jgi:hypothetical protein